MDLRRNLRHAARMGAWRLCLVLLAMAIALPGMPATAQDPQEGNAPEPATTADKDRQAAHPVLQQPVRPSQVSTPDGYGYAWDDTGTFEWIDAAGSGTQVDFSGCSDDCASTAIDLPFPFKFYEGTFSQIYASTNGILTFEAGSQSFANVRIPQDTPPNNLIAPLWADLVVGGGYNAGQVAAFAGEQGGVKYLAVEWHAVTLRGSAGALTFEAVLYEDGDIRFQYLDIAGSPASATVGIEDGDGVYGSLYLHAAPGIVSGKSLTFTRPDVTYNAKAYPLYQSAFAVNHLSSFTVSLTNTGKKGNDQFEVRSLSSAAGFQVSVYGANGSTRLLDADQNGNPETGVLAQDETSAIVVSVRSPQSASAGSFTVVELSLVSLHDPSRKAIVHLQSAVPAAFAQGLANTNSQDGMSQIAYYWEHSSTIQPVVDWFSGSTLALAGSGGGTYVYAWERAGSNTTGEQLEPFADIEYALLDRSNHMVYPNQKLTDNQSALLPTSDRYPAAAVSANGTIGVVWVRDVLDGSLSRTNSNVYFAALKPGGGVLVPPVSVTANSAWQGDGDLDIPRFSMPAISAGGGGRFVISWVDSRQIGAEQTSSDVGYTVYDPGTRTASPVVKVTSSASSGWLYQGPAGVSLAGGSTILAYSRLDEASGASQIAYAVIGSGGDLAGGETIVSGGVGWGADVTPLSTGNILLAWSTPAGGVAYTLLDSTFKPVIAAPVALSNPNGRPAGYLSVTFDLLGNGVLTWMDAGWNQFLYYALVGSDGQIVTPPMYFYQGNEDTPVVLTSLSGYGNAPYTGSLQVHIPMLVKQ